MDYCHVEFVPKDGESLRRTEALFQAIQAAELVEHLWYFVIVGGILFGLPLILVGAATGLVAEKLFGNRVTDV